MIKIEPYDSPTRYIASSEEHKDRSYIIDLEIWSCTCPDHCCRIYPQYRDGHIPKEKATCKHMDALIRKLGIGTAEALVENQLNQERAAKLKPVRINQADHDYPF